MGTAKHYITDTQIEIVHQVDGGQFKYALFDFDGTISLLRQGWENIMAPVMIEMICGDTEPARDIEPEVHDYIAESTGIQTILQMEHLVEMVRKHGLVPEDRILDAQDYKKMYNERLMVPVRERIAGLAGGKLTIEDVTLRGSRGFIKRLYEKGLTLYVFSGTDRDSVRNEAEKVGVSKYFKEIWGALRTYQEYSKEKVLKALMSAHNLRGAEVLVCGDGPVEVRTGKACGCVVIGVASDEAKGHGWNSTKRERLLRAGADILIPDFSEAQALVDFLFP